MVAAKPGKRFQARYEQRRRMRASVLWTPLYLILGSGLFVLGLTMMVAPGPGLIVLFMGAALIGQESLVVARALDRTEVGLRRAAHAALRGWRRAPLAAKAAVAILGACALAGAGWGAYAFFIG
jgi:hypothetical protein